jgi:hypothetical protein
MRSTTHLNHSESSPLFNRLTQSVREAKQGRASAEQWLATIKALAQKGVKQAEVTDIKLDEWLTMRGSDVITREELLDHIVRITPTVKEMVASEPKFANYVVKGGEYEEIYYVLASERDRQSDRLEEVEHEMELMALDASAGLETGDIETTLETITKFERERATLMETRKTAYDFTHHHWSTNVNLKNLLAHARVSTFPDGTYFIQEIQSDWAQMGRKTNWSENYPKAPLVTSTEAWAGMVLRRQLQRAAMRPDVKRISWMTETMRNGGTQNLDREATNAAQAKAFVDFTREKASFYMTAATPADRDATEAEAKALGETASAQAYSDFMRTKAEVIATAATPQDRQALEAQAKKAGDSAASKAIAEFVKQKVAAHTAAMTPEARANLEAGAATYASQRAREAGLTMPGDLLNEFYLRVLPKMADKALAGTGGSFKMSEVELGERTVTVPTLEITDAVRQKLIARQSVYSFAQVNQQAADESDTRFQEALFHAKKMVGDLAQVRLLKKVYDVASGHSVSGRTIGNLIQVSLAAKQPVEVMDHECMHFAMDNLLSTRERRILEDAFAVGSPLHRRVCDLALLDNEPRLARQCMDDPHEAIAQGFAYWAADRLQIDDHPPARGLFARLAQAVTVVGEWVRKIVLQEELQTVSEVFSHLAHGALAEREQLARLESQSHERHRASA